MQGDTVFKTLCYGHSILLCTETRQVFGTRDAARKRSSGGADLVGAPSHAGLVLIRYPWVILGYSEQGTGEYGILIRKTGLKSDL